MKRLLVKFEVDQSGSFGEAEAGQEISLKEAVAKDLIDRGIAKEVNPKTKKKVKDVSK